MRHILPLFAAALASTLVAQDNASPVSAANNAFAWDLYRALPKGKDNLFFSPYSIFAALAMTRAGAAGRTAEQMDLVLHFDGVKASSHQALAAALTKVLSDPDRCRALGNAASQRIAEWNYDADLAGLRAALASRHVASSTRR